jgi:uncharacterized pyridoxal phosphate-containing UPF0001 family protein
MARGRAIDALLQVNASGEGSKYGWSPDDVRAACEVLRAAGHPAEELSMGMSNDYEVAVEEGATMVRLGTVLFGARPS